MDVSSRTIGLNFTSDGDAKLVVWAPLAQKAGVKFHGNITSLIRNPLGLWEAKNLPVKEGDDYHIVVDNHVLPDPASLFQPNGVHAASQAFNLKMFQWHDQSWKGVPMEELIIYELHTGTFTKDGTFDAVSGKLDYLKDLGVNAIELMPVAQFPGDRNWGYDGVYPFAVQYSYGGPERLQHLVDQCHLKGIAVILDVVYNHLGPEGNYLPACGPVFTDKYKTPWGEAINFDDAWSDGLRMFVVENVLMWLRDFHIDGLRLDAVHAIKDFGAKHILREIKEHVNLLNEKTSSKHFLIGESDLNDIKFITPFEQGGYDLDASWCDEFHHSLHSLVTGETNGYYEDFGDITLLVKSFNDAYVFDGIWSGHRKRIFGNKTTGLPGHKFVVFIQNHDQVGNRMTGDRLSTLINFEVLKVTAGAMLVSPFIPMLFMGEEYAETNPFRYFTSHSDKELIRLVREGRKKEFKAFLGEGEVPDPHDTDTFNVSRLNWLNRNETQQQMFAYYRHLIHLRKTIPALKNTNRHDIFARQVDGHNALYLVRKFNDQTILSILNFEPAEIEVDIPELSSSSFQLLLNSSETRWGGTGRHTHAVSKVPPESLVIWTNK